MQFLAGFTRKKASTCRVKKKSPIPREINEFFFQCILQPTTAAFRTSLPFLVYPLVRQEPRVHLSNSSLFFLFRCEKVDLWGVGCILAELVLGRPIFRVDPNIAIDSSCECEHNNPDSLDARLFPSVVLAVAPAVIMDEVSSLSTCGVSAAFRASLPFLVYPLVRQEPRVNLSN